MAEIGKVHSPVKAQSAIGGVSAPNAAEVPSEPLFHGVDTAVARADGDFWENK